LVLNYQLRRHVSHHAERNDGVIEIECGRAEIDRSVRVIGLLQAAGRIERNVVIDKLAQVGVEGGNPALFVVGAIPWADRTR